MLCVLSVHCRACATKYSFNSLSWKLYNLSKKKKLQSLDYVWFFRNVVTCQQNWDKLGKCCDQSRVREKRERNILVIWWLGHKDPGTRWIQLLRKSIYAKCNKNRRSNIKNDAIQNYLLGDISKASQSKEKGYRITRISLIRSYGEYRIFDNDIHETPLVEDLLNEIIKRLKWTNNKINFLAHQFAQYLGNLPPTLFTDDGDNED